MMNTNFFHNVINFAILVLAGLAGFDWTVFGLDAEQTLAVTGFLALLKVVMNIARDGITGLTKVQPPVQDAKPDEPDYSAGV